ECARSGRKLWRGGPRASEDNRGGSRSEPKASEDHQGGSRSEPKASEDHQGGSRSEPKASEDHQGGERRPSGLASTVVDVTGPRPRVLRWGAIAEPALRAVLEEL